MTASPTLPTLVRLDRGWLELYGREAAERKITCRGGDGIVLEATGLESLDGNKLGVAIRKGEVWILDGVYGDPAKITYSRFASGLDEPLGLVRRGSNLLLAQRTEVTELEGYGLPTSVAVTAASPNPFNPETSFRISIPETGEDLHVHIAVYNTGGQQVAVLADESMHSGLYAVSWDGRDRNGNSVVDGLYIVTLEALGETRKQTLAVVR